MLRSNARDRGLHLNNEVQPLPEPHAGSDRIILLVAGIGGCLALLGVFWSHALSWDEIEFFRAADWIREGKVPYRDFWEHHTPLQWYLTAPLTAFGSGQGVGPVILMRWTQLPVWIGILWLALWISRQASSSRWSRHAALALVLSSWFFVHKAIEFRVDTFATLFYIAGLALLVGRDERWSAFAAGLSFALTTLANIRFAPLVVLTVLLIGIVNVHRKRWGWNRAMLDTMGGGALVTAIYSAYLLVTGSFHQAWRQLIVENAIADRYVKIGEFSPFWVRVGVPFGFRVDPQLVAFVLENIDLAAIVIWIAGTTGLVMAIRRERREPGPLFVLAFLQFASLLFIARMKNVYAYHFELVTVMMIPFVAVGIDRILSRKNSRLLRLEIVAVLITAALLNAWISVARGQSLSLQAQDSLMREVHARTKPEETVFDAVGWALHRAPAWQYWFLPMLVHLLDFHRVIPHITPEYLEKQPPAAVIFNSRLLIFLWSRPELAAFLTRHYVPLSTNLWIPGMSARLDSAKAEQSWRVPISGDYYVFGSGALSEHPWFHDPLRMAFYEGPEASVLEVKLSEFPFERADRMQFSVDGIPITPAGRVLRLRGGSTLSVRLLDERWPIGIIVLRGRESRLFRRAVHVATIDTGEHPAAVHRPAPLHWKKVFGWRDAHEYEVDLVEYTK